MQTRSRIQVSALALALIALLGIYAQAARILKADDDNLWLAYAVDKIHDRAAGDALENQVIQYAREAGADEHALMRLEMRRDYDANYRLALLAWAALDAVMVSGVQDADRRTTLRLTLALLPVVLLPWCGLFWLLVSARSERLWLAAVTVVGWFAMVSLFDVRYGDFVAFGHSAIKDIGTLFLFLLNPGPAFTLLGFTPRSMVTVTVMAAMLARWQRRDQLAYVLLALTVGLHTSLGLLVLFSVLVADVILARERLRDPVAIAILATGVLYGLWNERILQMVAPTFGLILVASLLPLAAVASWWVRTEHPAAGIPLLRPFMDGIGRLRSQATAPVGQDVATLFLCIVGLALVGFVASRLAPPLSVKYFWGQLPTRFYAAAGPSMLIGAVWILYGRMNSRRRSSVTATVTAIALIGGVLFAARHPSPVGSIARQLAQYDDTLARGERADGTQLIDERLVYFELGRALVDGRDPVARLRARTSGPRSR